MRDFSECVIVIVIVIVGSARRYAATALWARIVLRSPWYGASLGAVPGAPGSLTPGVSRVHVQAAWTCGFFFRAMSTGTWPQLGALVGMDGQTPLLNTHVRTTTTTTKRFTQNSVASCVACTVKT